MIIREYFWYGIHFRQINEQFRLEVFALKKLFSFILHIGEYWKLDQDKDCVATAST